MNSFVSLWKIGRWYKSLVHSLNAISYVINDTNNGDINDAMYLRMLS